MNHCINAFTPPVNNSVSEIEALATLEYELTELLEQESELEESDGMPELRKNLQARIGCTDAEFTSISNEFMTYLKAVEEHSEKYCDLTKKILIMKEQIRMLDRHISFPTHSISRNYGLCF